MLLIDLNNMEIILITFVEDKNKSFYNFKF